MRAIFLGASQFLDHQENFVIKDDNAHHLIKVVRIQLHEKILILDGKGNKRFCSITQINKKEVHLQLDKKIFETRKHNIDVFLGAPKKEAFEKIIKLSVELGISQLYPFTGAFTQLKNFSEERASRLIESSIIQSNNPYLLKISPFLPFQNIIELSKNYKSVLYFTPQASPQDISTSFTQEDKILLIIGPEAGPSLEEEKTLLSIPNMAFLSLNTYILRSETALATAMGYALAFYKKSSF